jgi:hypothetical protein
MPPKNPKSRGAFQAKQEPLRQSARSANSSKLFGRTKEQQEAVEATRAESYARRESEANLRRAAIASRATQSQVEMSSVGPTGNGVTEAGQATASQDLPQDKQQEADKTFVRPLLPSQTSSTASVEEEQPNEAWDIFETSCQLINDLVDELDYMVELKQPPDQIKNQDALLRQHWVPYHVAATTYVATLPLLEANRFRCSSVRLGEHIDARRKAARTYSKSAKAQLEREKRQSCQIHQP